ncbi:DegT/DnrJ/EryC1/StrS family aminotransferase [Vicingus serpentipes]|uniref:DegT/DnrJ/EryC1/StrS family aminotransferase n=1 Tax=Vicingus serpentipes TaxID=1926625 RepID=UPI001CB99527|nr:DegT/DnrJ/EryC1/StrS family aminotransferase [Vicingus serpentipes]
MKKPKNPILVTQPTLPNLDEFHASLKEIWASKWITNKGAFHQQFELELAKHLGVKYVSIFNNATIALLTALQALEIKGEVITTPYSFVATANSLMWNNLTPVFCDVDPIYGNLDAAKIENLITPNTTAIMPVHVYGTPCDVIAIEQVAKKHKLKVIYDAAHAFGVEVNNNSILNYGDLSVLSFHATKAFNTVEGGAIICHDDATKEKIDNLKNFGITDEITVVAPGINGKVNELIAAYGLLQLKTIDSDIEKCKTITTYYKEHLANIEGLKCMPDIKNTKLNYSYFPIFIDEEKFGMSRDELYFKLKENNIFGRRYFYPLITDFNTYKNFDSSNLPIAKKIASQVICLPIYAGLTTAEVNYITAIINS